MVWCGTPLCNACPIGVFTLHGSVDSRHALPFVLFQLRLDCKSSSSWVPFPDRIGPDRWPTTTPAQPSPVACLLLCNVLSHIVCNFLNLHYFPFASFASKENPSVEIVKYNMTIPKSIMIINCIRYIITYIFILYLNKLNGYVLP